MVGTTSKELGIYLNDEEKGFLIVENLLLKDSINFLKVDDRGTLYLLLESKKAAYEEANPNDTTSEDSLYYRLRMCPELSYGRGKDYWFRIKRTTDKWKPKLA